jgi:glycosyltransferase involved in cell wall biosynthesis
MTDNTPYVTVVVAVKNERDNVKPLVKEIYDAFTPKEIDFEILYVDDGSTDGTFDTVIETSKDYPRLRAIQFEKNYGQSCALVAGINDARGELIAILDGDLQNDPADFPRMISILEEKSVGMVTGIRAKRHDNSFRRIQSKIANWVRNKITGDDIVDSACAVRVFKKSCFGKIIKFNGMHRFLPTLFRMAGCKVIQTPVNHRERKFGTAKYGMLNRVFKATRDLFAVRWLQKNYIRYKIKR